MKEWTPNSSYGGHAFGFKGDPAKKISQFDEFLAKRDTILPWIAEYSPYALVTAGRSADLSRPTARRPRSARSRRTRRTRRTSA